MPSRKSKRRDRAAKSILLVRGVMGSCYCRFSVSLVCLFFSLSLSFFFFFFTPEVMNTDYCNFVVVCSVGWIIVFGC